MMGLDVHDMEDLGQIYVGYDDEIRPSSQFGLASLRIDVYKRQIEGSFERKSNEIENEQWGTRHIISFDLTLPDVYKRQVWKGTGGCDLTA